MLSKTWIGLSKSQGRIELTFSSPVDYSEAHITAKQLYPDHYGCLMTPDEETAYYSKPCYTLVAMPFVKAAFLGDSKIKQGDPKLGLLQLTEYRFKKLRATKK